MITKTRPIALAALALLGGLSTAAMAQSRSTYIVQLAAEPAATYDGSTAGYAATRAAAGQRFNSRAPAAAAYVNYLTSLQNSVAATVPAAPVIQRYNTAFNGFAAQLTPAEVMKLKTNPNVVSVSVDEARSPDTISTPKFLKLSEPGGLWSQLANGVAVKGEDVIIGVVDSGVWPEHTSYADRVNNGVPVFSGGSLAYGTPPAGWNGACETGEGFTTAHCNNKLIGARFFNAGFVANRGSLKHFTEFYSPRDSGAGPNGHGGHGTHTSSTSGGNGSATAIVAGQNLGLASGIAPRARIAAYKVCYTYINPAATDGTGSSNTCFTSDSVAAIDRAVADGVHVINFSISGSQTSVNDPVEQAFLRAASAGVFVATSAGNAGPANAVAHVSPWLTTVAASTHSRALSADVTLGNGNSYTGLSMATAVPSAPLIRAEDAVLPGATNPTLCFSNPASLDPVKVAGKIVICTRGISARVDKSLAVKNAGGVGMVLADNGAGLIAEAHSVPTVHVNQADGNAIKSYAVANGAGATASIGAFYDKIAPAPLMAGFSSRGPNMGDANMLKPDITAPGVDVIAAVTADLSPAQRDAVANGTLVPPADWASYQGTSMSSPHIAGMAALLRQAHPTWSPQAIKSALMTTASTTLDDSLPGAQNGLLPWAQGAGHANPNLATDPGLVYDNGPNDFIRYQCKANRAAVLPATLCTSIGTLDETYNYNLPSITVGALLGSTPTTVTRRVTNVGSSTATYNAAASLPGFNISVSPPTLTLAPGETKPFTVTMSRVSAVENVWSFGSLTWTDGTHTVRSPVQARVGKIFEAPTMVTGTTTSGTRLVSVKVGFSGRMTAAKGGMKPVTLGDAVSKGRQQLSSGQLAQICAAGSDTASVKVYPITIPANTLVARFETRNADSTPNSDHDLLILFPNNTSGLYSGNDGSNEAVQVAEPAAGNYKVCVVNWASPDVTASHRLSSWVVTTADASSTLNVMLPGSVTPGTATVGLSWSGLANGGRYLGAVGYRAPSTGASIGSTVVYVTPGSAAPTAAGTSSTGAAHKMDR
jgi:subtilisin family serine protease